MSKKMMAVILSVSVVLVVALMLSSGSNKTNQQQRKYVKEQEIQKQEQEQKRIQQEQKQKRIQQSILSLEKRFEKSTSIFNDDEKSIIEIRDELYRLLKEVPVLDLELKNRINKLIKKCDDKW